MSNEGPKRAEIKVMPLLTVPVGGKKSHRRPLKRKKRNAAKNQNLNKSS